MVIIFKLKEVQLNKSLPAHEETVTNKADGKATFSKLTFNKAELTLTQSLVTPGSMQNAGYVTHDSYDDWVTKIRGRSR